MIRGAIFDFDGTLFDSMSIWTHVGEDYLRSAGRQPEPGLSQTIETMSLYQSACYCKRVYALNESPQEIMDGFSAIVRDYYFYEVQPKPGVRAFLDDLRGKHVSMCIATATERSQIEAALRRCGLADNFSHILTCSEVGHGKDEPHIYRQALCQLRTKKEETIVFEDALHAAATAKEDGFLVAGVRDDYERNPAGVRALVDVYLESFERMDSFWKQLGTLC